MKTGQLTAAPSAGCSAEQHLKTGRAVGQQQPAQVTREAVSSLGGCHHGVDGSAALCGVSPHVELPRSATTHRASPGTEDEPPAAPP